MTIKIPDKFMGKPIQGSIERVLAGADSQQTSSIITSRVAPHPATNINNPQDYIILEGRTHGNYSYPDLLVAMDRTHLGKNWNDSHLELAKEGAFMLSIRQFVDFLNILRSKKAYDGNGNSINDVKLYSIWDEILKVRDPWRSEWLDANFKIKERNVLGLGGKLFIDYEHRVVNGILTPGRSEELEEYLMENKLPGIDLSNWLQSATYQGLPPKNVNAGDLYYWRPGRDNNSVAGFGSDSNWAVLNCGRNPSVSGASLGVRAAREKK